MPLLLKSDLMSVANEAAASFGSARISESVLERWIGADFVPSARARGRRRAVNPDWVYPSDAGGAVRAVVWLHANGARRDAEKSICLFAFGCSRDHDEIVAALRSELRRIAKRLERTRAFWDFAAADKLTPDQREKLMARLPPLDPRLAQTEFKVSDLAAWEVSWRAVVGEKGRGDIPRIVASDFAASFEMPDEAFPFLQPLFDQLLCVSGAFGLPETCVNGGYQILSTATPDDLDS